jgi:hypothetical protein
MSKTDKLWSAFSTVVKMNDRVVNLATVTVAQQAKIEALTAQVIRLENALESVRSDRTAGAGARLRRNLKRK